MSKLWMALLLIGFAVTAACNDSGDSKGGDDAGTDDTDPEDTDAACPLNSGYPCFCEADSVECEDATPCAIFNTGAEYGVCTKPCTGFEDTVSCVDTSGFGVDQNAGQCLFTIGDFPDTTNCAVVCYLSGATGDCPPGLDCITVDAESSVCIP